MFTPEALAQNKRVLCTDGNDQSKANGQALKKDRQYQFA
jgi:hypothetical protein